MKALFGRKMVVLYLVVFVALVALVGNKWILPTDLKMSTMIVEAVFGAIWKVAAFIVGGNILADHGGGLKGVAEFFKGSPKKPE